MKTSFKISFFYILFLLLVSSCQFSTSSSESKSKNKDTLSIDLWSGNRTQIRKNYERALLEASLQATEVDFGPWKINETDEEYPGDEESKVFTEKNHDVFVTIAGNQKFKNQEVFIIEKPLAKNLLGYRIPIAHHKVSDKFTSEAKTSDLQQLMHGIPETWSDVQIFEKNGYSVLEKGDLDGLFERLSNYEFDYSAFGANEVQSVFENRASQFDNLKIAEGVLFFYPFPMIFYVNPKQKPLTNRLEKGLDIIEKNGVKDSIFNSFYGTLLDDLKLKERQIIVLQNPFIPETFKNLQPDL